NSRMQKSTEVAARDVDLILYLIDAHAGVQEEDKKSLIKFATGDIPLVLVLTKTDIMPKENIPLMVAEFEDVENIDKIITVSARRGKNLGKLTDEILKWLPEGDPIFSDDIISDRSEKFMISEIMREKMLLKYDKEIPHGVAIVINTFERQPNGVYDINLDIVCEKFNHKAIIIGKQGAKLKEVSSFARQAMEKFLDAKVFLTVYVKVKEGWRDNPSRLREYGYSDEDFY
ncbi:MAG: GTPase Era, partial [Clostridia bacterium]|nr:GTPase Era [Clostridia bacterium]